MAIVGAVRSEGETIFMVGGLGASHTVRAASDRHRPRHDGTHAFVGTFAGAPAVLLQRRPPRAACASSLNTSGSRSGRRPDQDGRLPRLVAGSTQLADRSLRCPAVDVTAVRDRARPVVLPGREFGVARIARSFCRWTAAAAAPSGHLVIGGLALPRRPDALEVPARRTETIRVRDPLGMALVRRTPSGACTGSGSLTRRAGTGTPALGGCRRLSGWFQVPARVEVPQLLSPVRV